MKDRNDGISLLRIFSMFGIVGLHVINNGGIINNLSIYSYKYYFVLLFLTIIYCSVDVFALMSGFLNINKTVNKHSGIVELLFILLFYCLIIPIIFYSFNLCNIRFLGLKNLIINFVPFLVGRYWYITSYVFLFFLIPYINFFIKSLSKKRAKKFLLLSFVFLSIIPNLFFQIDLFKINNGYSPFWLIYLYMVGGYIKLHSNKIEKKSVLKYMFAFLLCAFIFNCFIRIITNIIFGKIYNPEYFINYISPFIVGMSICLLLIFNNISIKEIKLKKIINYLSSSAFSVYIIHSHKIIFDYVLRDFFIPLNSHNVVLLMLCIIMSIIIIYLICTLIDEIRKFIFKFLKINYLIDIIGKKIDLLLE